MKIIYHKIMLVVFSFLIFNYTILAQNKNILAKIGNIEITVDEYISRYEFSPYISMAGITPDSIKKNFLYSLIAEKLWSLKAEEIELDDFNKISEGLSFLNKSLIRDELYKSKINNKIFVSKNEIADGLKNVDILLYTTVFVSIDSLIIAEIFEGYGTHTNSIKNVQQYSYPIKFGQMLDETLETNLFKLKPNEFAKPYKSPNGWMLFHLDSTFFNSDINYSNLHKRNKVVELIRKRKEINLTDNFANRLLHGNIVKVDKKLFNKLCYEILEIFKSATTSQFIIGDYELSKIKLSFSTNSLNSPFIKFDDEPISLNDFLSMLSFNIFKFSSLDISTIIGEMNSYIKGFIEHELAYRYAIANNYKLSEESQFIINQWRDYFLYESLMRDYFNDIYISDKEVQSFYNLKTLVGTDKHTSFDEIIITDSKLMEELYSKLVIPTKFDSLFKYYNKHTDSGVLVSTRLVLSDRTNKYFDEIYTSEVGAVVGPVMLPDGFAFIKLKKEFHNNVVEYKDIKEQAMREIKLKRFADILKYKTIEFAAEKTIKINYDLLDVITLNDIKTITYKLIGFGGRMQALPFTIPNEEWYSKFLKNIKLP